MTKVEVDVEKMQEFQKKLLEDKAFRERFAADPGAVIKEYGIQVPEESIPEKVDLEALEERASKAAGAAGGTIPITVWW